MALNKRKAASFFLTVSVLFMIATGDNPVVRNASGANYRNKPYPWASLLRHVVMIGGIMLILNDRTVAVKDQQVKEKT